MAARPIAWRSLLTTDHRQLTTVLPAPKPSRLESRPALRPAHRPAWGPDLRRHRQIRLALGKDHEKAVGPFAHTGGLHALEPLAGHMQHAPLAAVHGRKTIGHPRLPHLLRGG